MDLTIIKIAEEFQKINNTNTINNLNEIKEKFIELLKTNVFFPSALSL